MKRLPSAFGAVTTAANVGDGPIGTTARQVALSVLRTLIVDDEPLARRLLRELLSHQSQIEIVGECADGASAALALAELRPDLVFLDIQMPSSSGIQLLRGLRPPRPYIVFVTAHDEFAVHAFELDACDYVLKPVERWRLDASVQRASELLRVRELVDAGDQLMRVAAELTRLQAAPTAVRTAPLVVRRGNACVQINWHRVRWIEASGQYVTIHLENESIVHSASLAQIAARLDPRQFLRVHRSAIVNLQFVVTVRPRRNGVYDLILEGDELVPLARNRRGLLPRLLARTAPR